MGEKTNHSFFDIVLSCVIGGMVGAGIVLLSTPQSGRELRNNIRKSTGNFADKSKRLISGAGSRISSNIDKGKSLFADSKSALAAAIEAGKEAYAQETEGLLKPGEEE